MSKASSENLASSPRWAPTWARALTVSAGILLALWLFLGFLPHRLTILIDEAGWPGWIRDVLVTGFFTVVFGGIAGSLYFLQKKGRI